MKNNWIRFLAGALVFALQKSGALTSMRASLEH